MPHLSTSSHLLPALSQTTQTYIHLSGLLKLLNFELEKVTQSLGDSVCFTVKLCGIA